MMIAPISLEISGLITIIIIIEMPIMVKNYMSKITNIRPVISIQVGDSHHATELQFHI